MSETLVWFVFNFRDQFPRYVVFQAYFSDIFQADFSRNDPLCHVFFFFEVLVCPLVIVGAGQLELQRLSWDFSTHQTAQFRRAHFFPDFHRLRNSFGLVCYGVVRLFQRPKIDFLYCN